MREFITGMKNLDVSLQTYLLYEVKFHNMFSVFQVTVQPRYQILDDTVITSCDEKVSMWLFKTNLF